MSDSASMDSLIPARKHGLLAWLVCLSAGLFFFYEFFQLNVFDVINGPIREEFGLDPTKMSWLSSTYLWADILFLLPAGLILDRISTRTVILTAMAICIIGTFGFAFTHSFYLACFFHFLSGIGNAFCFLSCIVLISQWFPARRQALLVGIVVTMAFVGGMMAHTPFVWLNEQVGWRRALKIDAEVGMILFAWIYFIVREKVSVQERQSGRSWKQNGFLNALMNRQNWLAGMYTSFLNLPIMVICALWGASYLMDVHHLEHYSAANTVNMIFIGSILGCPLAGWLSDSLGRRKPLMIIGALLTLLTVMPLFIFKQLTLIELQTIFFLLGLFTSTQVISYPLVAESNDISITGAATGVASVVIMGGGGVGQVLFGKLMQSHAGQTVQHFSAADYQFAMWIFPISAILALLAVLLCRETYCRRHK